MQTNLVLNRHKHNSYYTCAFAKKQGGRYMTNEQKIQELEGQIEKAEGSETEVYSRIVGYFRPLKNWNNGARDQYSHRQVYDNK